MGKIFCLMGKSSTGKDTIYKELLADSDLRLTRIVPYTTRPIRNGEENGVEYHFTDESAMQKFQKENKIIEVRSYDTYYGIWKYFTVCDEQINLDRNDYLIITTPESYLSMEKYFGVGKTVPVLIELDDGIRLRRALDREAAQEKPGYEEMCRRFLADAEDFSDEHLKECGISKRFLNNNLNECIGQIREFIQENR